MQTRSCEYLRVKQLLFKSILLWDFKMENTKKLLTIASFLFLSNFAMAMEDDADLFNSQSGMEIGDDATPIQEDLKWTPLMIAVEKQDVQAVERLVNLGQINDVNSEGRTALMIACTESSLEIVQAILDANADIEIQDKCGCTALMDAAFKGNKEMIEMLLRKKADVNAINNTGETALMLALEYPNNNTIEIIEMLLDKHAWVDIKNEEGDTPLMLAAENGHTEIVKILCSFSAQVNVQNKIGDTPLMLAAENGHTDTAEALFGLINEQYKQYTGVPSVQDGYPETAEALSYVRVYINHQNSYGENALMLAARNGHTLTVKVLYNLCVNDINTRNLQGNTALMLAAENGHTETVEELSHLRAYVDLQNQQGETALMLAAKNNHTETVKMLYNLCANNIDAQNQQGNTALMLASANGHTETMETLLNLGANINIQNLQGNTVLLLAARNDHIATIIKLIALYFKEFKLATNNENMQVMILLRIHLNAQNAQGETALMLVAKNNHPEIVKILFNLGADDLNQHDKQGNTALMLASKNGHTETVQMLLALGADLAIQNNLGHIALELAARKGHLDICNILKYRHRYT